MEVVHHSDYDTHAIMGGGETQSFGIINSAEFITVLSSTLYSDAFLAVIREVVCNAWDAHKITGKENIPVEITIDSSKLTIKDFGPGIDPAKMRDIYCTYGGSTKKAQDNQTGGFGLGSKSPFAYTNHFTVTVNYNGTKTIWAISRGSAETKGMPDARPIVKVPTTETGVEVEIPINDPHDVSKFKNVIFDIVGFGEINATLNGDYIKTIPISRAHEGVLFTSTKPPTYNGLLYVRYGNVVYPIPSHREYEVLYSSALELMERTGNESSGSYSYRKRDPLVAIFEAPPNSISVTPSRESIHTSDRTIETIKNLLSGFLDRAKGLGGSHYILKHEQQIIDTWFETKKDSRQLLLVDNLIKNYYTNKDSKYYSLKGHFLSIEEMVIGLAANGFGYDDNVLAKAKRIRINQVIKRDSIDSDLMKKLKKVLNKNPYLWHGGFQTTIHNHYTNILSRAAAAKLNPKNFILWDANGYAGRKAYAGTELYKANDSIQNLLKLSRRVILLVEHKGQIGDYLYKIPKPDGWDLVPAEGCLVYQLGSRRYASYEDTIKFFKKKGFIIIDLIAWHEANRPKIAPVKPVIKAPVVKKPKNSYMSLTNLLYEANGNIHFGYRQHLDKPKEKLQYITNPEFIMRGRNTSQRSYDKKFFVFGDRQGLGIVQHWGAKGAIAKSDLEMQKAIEAGAINGTDWIINKVYNEFKTNPVFKNYLTYTNAFRIFRGNISQDDYGNIQEYSRSGSKLKKLPVLNDEETLILNIIDRFEYTRHHIPYSHRAKLDELITLRDDWKKGLHSNPLEGVFSKDFSDRLKFLRFDKLIDEIKNPNIDPRTKAFLETLISTALFA